MPKKNILRTLILYPLSRIYGMVVYLRNKLFDWHILKQQTFDVPLVVVGNISAGGTGKTPHVEYIVDILRKNYHIGVVSRGYKRKTKGFVLATKRTSPLDIGDEPYQIYQKFGGEVCVAVCEDRVNGIKELLRVDPKINLIVLDDAFQHRYVKPTVAVVVSEFNRPVYEDYLLPYGMLRESVSALRRADMVVISKCPDTVKAVDFTICEKHLDLFAYQKVLFSTFDYGCLKPVFPEQAPIVAPSLDWLTRNDSLLIIAGIGNPKPFVMYIKRFAAKVKVNIFPDHHNFTKKDMQLILNRFNSLKGNNRYIITTEKDAVRLANSPYFPAELRQYTYFLPITVKILRDEANRFEEELVKLIGS